MEVYYTRRFVEHSDNHPSLACTYIYTARISHRREREGREGGGIRWEMEEERKKMLNSHCARAPTIICCGSAAVSWWWLAGKHMIGLWKDTGHQGKQTCMRFSHLVS